jgi:RNA polymerase sigma-70 factor (ECF subfamily)
MADRDVLTELLNRSANGDRQAFATLYRRVSPKLYAVCVTLLKQRDMAEDVLQDSFVKIWNRAGTYNPSKGSAITWMTSIVRNRALDMMRSSHPQLEQSADEYRELELVDDTRNPPDSLEFNTSTAALNRCLKQLKNGQRKCILMAYYYGYTHDELAQRLNTPLGTVKAWIRRGLERIRECLG